MGFLLRSHYARPHTKVLTVPRWYDLTGTTLTIGTFALPATGAWFHWCIERDATGKVRIYIDGVLKYSASGAEFYDTGGSWFLIGSTSSGAASAGTYRGRAAEIRLTKVALYASDSGFSPPNDPFARGNGSGGDPHYDDVVLLMQDHTDDTGLTELNDFTDRGPIGLPINTAGNTFISTSNQRGTRSGCLDTTGISAFTARRYTQAEAQYLNFYDRTIPFTAEAWIRPNSGALSGTKQLLGQWYNTNGKQWMLALASGKLHLKLSSDGSTSTDTTDGGAALAANTWYHVALVRDASATYHIYLDGLLRFTVSSFAGTDLYDVTGASFQYFNLMGTYATSNAFDGKFCGVRITRGVDRYSGGAGAPTYDMHKAYAA